MNKSFQDKIVANAEAMVKSDISSKSVFEDTFLELKGAGVQSVDSAIKGLVADTKELLNEKYTNNVINRIIRNIRLAGSWYGKKMFSKFEHLTMSNIESGLRLLDYLDSNDKKEEYTRVRNSLNKIKCVTQVAYNNEFEHKVKEFYKEYKVVLTDDGKVMEVKLTRQGMDTLVTQLKSNPELLSYLMTELVKAKDSITEEEEEAVA